MSVWRFPGPVQSEERCASGHVKRAGLHGSGPGADPSASEEQRHVSKLRSVGEPLRQVRFLMWRLQVTKFRLAFLRRRVPALSGRA